jgi:hypothetical protein
MIAARKHPRPAEPNFDPPGEAFLARLTAAAYQAALRHGTRGSFLDLQLDIWRALRRALRAEVASREARKWPE